MPGSQAGLGVDDLELARARGQVRSPLLERPSLPLRILSHVLPKSGFTKQLKAINLGIANAQSQGRGSQVSALRATGHKVKVVGVLLLSHQAKETNRVTKGAAVEHQRGAGCPAYPKSIDGRLETSRAAVRHEPSFTGVCLWRSPFFDNPSQTLFRGPVQHYE